jgi:hypothetical protein
MICLSIAAIVMLAVRPAAAHVAVSGAAGSPVHPAASTVAFTLRAQVGGPPGAVVADDKQVYFAAGHSVIVAVSADNDTLRSVAASPPLPAPIERMVLRGDVLWVADGTGGLWSLAVHGLERPTVLGHVHLPGTALDVTIDGERAYVAGGARGGLHIVDVRDPGAPRRVGGVDTAGGAVGVAVAGEHAFVADAELGLAVIDVSDPAHPMQAGTVPSGIRADAVAARGELVYVLDGAVGLRTLAFAERSELVLRGTARLSGRSTSLLLGEELAYVMTEDPASGNTVVSYVDISRADGLPVVARHEVSGQQKRGLARFGDQLLLGSGSTYVSTLQRLPAGRSQPTSAWVSLNVPSTVTRLNGEADQPVVGVSCSQWHFAVDVDESHRLGRPRWIPIFGSRATVAQDTAYVLDKSEAGTTLLRIVDVDGRSEGVSYVYIDQPYDIASLLIAHGETLFFARSTTVTAIDVSSPQRPTFGKARDIPATLRDLAVSGNLAVGLSVGRIFALSVRPVTRVNVLGSVAAAAGYSDMVSLYGLRAVFSAERASIGVVDLTHPDQPQLSASLAVPVEDLTLGPDYAFTIHGHTLRAIDVATSPPREVGRIDLDYELTAVLWAAGRLVVGTKGGGVLVFDVAAMPAATATAQPTPSPTPSPGPTNTPSPSPTSTAAPVTATVVPPTASATPAGPRPIFLPRVDDPAPGQSSPPWRRPG